MVRGRAGRFFTVAVVVRGVVDKRKISSSEDEDEERKEEDEGWRMVAEAAGEGLLVDEVVCEERGKIGSVGGAALDAAANRESSEEESEWSVAVRPSAMAALLERGQSGQGGWSISAGGRGG